MYVIIGDPSVRYVMYSINATKLLINGYCIVFL